MEIQFGMNRHLLIIKKYVGSNKLLSFVAAYFFVSVFLKSVVNIDVCIPCLWKTVFGFTCPGCGTTTAFVELTRFNFSGAYHTNALIFIIIPLICVSIFIDFNKFRKRAKEQN